MKKTITIFDYIMSELINSGHNEFFNDNQLTMQSDKHSFIKKIMFYDDDVNAIVTKRIFQDFNFTNPETDIHFKRMFINKFLNRQIKFQTIEEFSTQVIQLLFSLDKYIEFAYENLFDMIKGKSVTDSTSKNVSQYDNRHLMSELPQDNINLNVADTILNYGNTNDISRNKGTDDRTSKNTGTVLDVDKFRKTYDLFIEILENFDRVCFSQFW